jgi:broad specificity phosphatase PhoE
MNKYLILVKHSLPEIIKELPANKWKLSKQGQARAHELAVQLDCYQPEVIVSSNEPKAKETAEIIARKCQLELHTIGDLHEHDRSNESYLSKDEFQASIRELFQQSNVLIFGRETANQAHARFTRSVHSILNNHANKTVVIVSHGTVIALFVARLTGLSDLLLWQELGLPSFIVIDLQSKTVIAKENIV